MPLSTGSEVTATWATLTPAPIGWNRQPQSLNLIIPPLAILIFKQLPK